MFALDLFKTKYEQELQEGAVDDLEARRIDILNDRMQDLLARAKEPAYRSNPAALASLKKQFQQVKDERDNYYKVREGSITPTATGLRHHARPDTYGGYEPEADPLARLDKKGVNRADKAMGVKFNREKKYQGGLDVDETGIPGNVPTEKIPGKEDLLKGKGRSYYEGADEDKAEIRRKIRSEIIDDKLRAKMQNAEKAKVQKKSSEPVDEGYMSGLQAELADVYNRLAPGIEKHKDSFKAGQLYDALEAVAEKNDAEAEFKRMMNSARNRAHMEYDTNPGGFHNWFWFLPFADDQNEGVAEEQKPGFGEFPAKQEITIVPPKKLKSGETYQDRNKYWQSQGQAPIYKTNEDQHFQEEQDTSGVESAIIRRIMVAHTDLLKQFGPDKVMQAAEEVAYNVGDVDEIGTSDVSAYVAQVKQILGATP